MPQVILGALSAALLWAPRPAGPLVTGPGPAPVSPKGDPDSGAKRQNANARHLASKLKGGSAKGDPASNPYQVADPEAGALWRVTGRGG